MDKKELTCNKCGYTWTPRKDNVKACPYCKGYFKIEKKEEKKDK